MERFQGIKPSLPRVMAFLLLPADSSVIIMEKSVFQGKKSTNPKSTHELLTPLFVSENLPLQNCLYGFLG